MQPLDTSSRLNSLRTSSASNSTTTAALQERGKASPLSGVGRLLQTPPTLRGTLRKRSRLTKSWVSRSAELRSHVLVLRGNGSTKAYDLTEAVRVKPDEDSKPPSFSIDFGPERRILQLCAANEAELNVWLHAVQKARQTLHREDFDLLRVLGGGHFGKVFLARQRRGAGAGDLVAVKEVALPRDESHVRSALTEREVLGAVGGHPFVVNLRHAFRTGASLYFVLDFYAGADLYEHLRRYPSKAVPGARFYAAEVLLGLQHLHANGVVYRDLKPENILVGRDGHVALADFGLSKRLSEGERTRTICGTRAYLSPEMLVGRGYGKEVDFWQFGCFLFELHAGRSPFWAPRVARSGAGDPTAALILAGEFEYLKTMDEPTRDAIGKLLVTQPARRLCDWDEVRALPFFAGLDWQEALRKELVPPALPLPEGDDHVANFGDMFVLTPAAWSADPVAKASRRKAPAYVEDSTSRELLGFTFSRGEGASSSLRGGSRATAAEAAPAASA